VFLKPASPTVLLDKGLGTQVQNQWKQKKMLRIETGAYLWEGKRIPRKQQSLGKASQLFINTRYRIGK